MLPEQLVHQLRLTDGTIVRLCPTPKPLYCSRDGRFFSPARAVLTDDGWVMYLLTVQTYGVGRKDTRNHGFRPRLSEAQAGINIDAHVLVWETWVGPRKKTDADGVKWEIDHINGDLLNWNLDNLEEITAEENVRRRSILYRMRKEGKDPTQIPIAELKRIFNSSTNKQI